MDFTPNVEDIALFFMKNGALEKRWISHATYTDPKYEIALDPSWKGSIFIEQEVKANPNSFFRVVNLALLLAASSTPAELPRATTTSPPPVPPEVDDLVVVPWVPDKPTRAFLIKKEVYEQGPPLVEQDVSDLVYMVLNEGVVLANVPKLGNMIGVTCRLLNLTSLRSVIGNKDQNKTDYARSTGKVGR